MAARALVVAALAIAACKEPPDAGGARPAPTDVEDEEAVRTAICPDGKCLPVPEGIRGLSFGMSRDQAGRAIGRLWLRKPRTNTVAWGDCSERMQAPGIRAKVTTTIGSETAKCELWFLKPNESPDNVGGLALIDCSLDDRRARAEHTETAWLLYQSLAKQYGQAHSISDRLAAIGRLKAIWTGKNAELILTADLRGRRSTIELINRSARYQTAIDAQVAGVKARCELEAANRRREAEEQERRRRDRAKEFERDLRPSLEKPQKP